MYRRRQDSSSTLSQRLRPWTNYIALAAATGLLCLIAIVLIGEDRRAGPQTFIPNAMLPGLSEKLGDVVRLEIITEGQHVILEPDESGRWVISNYQRYPVRFDLLRQTIVGLSTLTLMEERTARAEWHHYLDLVNPGEGGKARRYVLYGKKGQTIADILIGKTSDYAPLSGDSRFYVRHANEAQTYLAKWQLPHTDNLEAWLDNTIISLPRTRIAYVEMTPSSGPSYRLDQASPEADFALQAKPKNREIRSTSALNAVAGALVALKFEDVVSADKIDFKKSSRARYVTHDGLAITAQVTPVDATTGGYVKLSAQMQTMSSEDENADSTLSALESALGVEADQPAQGNVEDEIKKLNARFSGWAYKIPAFKADLLSRPLDALLQPAVTQPRSTKRLKAAVKSRR